MNYASGWPGQQILNVVSQQNTIAKDLTPTTRQIYHKTIQTDQSNT